MRNSEKPEGFYVDIHKSLVDPILIGGIDRNLCLGLWSIGVSIGIMLKMYWFFIIVIAVHIFIRNMTKKDSDYFQIVISHIQNKDYYDV